MAKTIFDEVNILDNPFKVLGIPEDSNNETIKEAYKLVKQSLAPDKRQRVEESYNLIKNEHLRERYKLLKNKPMNSIDEIKNYGIKPIKLNASSWIELIIKSQPEA